MNRFRLRPPSPALIVATVALIFALGGSSYAAFKLGRNTVGTKQLKNGAVTTKKLANGSVTVRKLNLKGVGALSKLVLGSQDTETGVYGAAAPSGFEVAPIDFIPKLASAPANSQYVASGTTAQCPGRGRAAAGYLCIYQGFAFGTSLDCIGSPIAGCGGKPTVDGAELYFFASGATPSTTGTWAYTAP